jgi:tetratricopeptide (TPR) repeat protein
VMAYKGTTKEARQIGQELGVGHLVQGSVRRAGDRVRISAGLIDARLGEQLWAETYDRQLTDIFQIQSEIAGQIATALQARLSPQERARIAQGQTTNVTAYELFLKGREIYQANPRDNAREALAVFREAVALDPQYAPAWAWLALVYGAMSGEGGEEWGDSAWVASERAVEVAPHLPDGYAARAAIYMGQGRYREAREQLDQALRLDPNHDRAISFLSGVYYSLGRLDEALRLRKRIAALEPTVPWRYLQLGLVYEALGELDQAERAYRDAERLAPNHPTPPWMRIRLQARRGQYRQAAEQLVARLEHWPTSEDRFVALSGVGWYELLAGDTAGALRHLEAAEAIRPPRFPPNSLLAFLSAARGEQARAESMLRQIEQDLQAKLSAGSEDPEPLFELAEVQAIRGDRVAALRYLQQAYDRGWRHAWWTEVNPMFANLRGEPAFQRLVSQMKGDVERMRQRVEREGW